MSLSALRVLTVDSQISTLRNTQLLLARIGITSVDVAYNGQEALQKLTQGKYHLVLCEWDMVPMTGLELLQYVRRDATYNHKSVAFILVKPLNSPSTLIGQAHGAGASNCIERPFDAKILEASIKAVIKV